MKDIKVIFMGTPDFSVPILQMLIDKMDVVLVVTQPDKIAGRHQILTPSPVKELALKYQIPVFQPSKIRIEYDTVLNTPCDMIITCAYGQIIPKCILDYPRLGCINVHASLLPLYRGGAPIHHALLNGDKETGISIMYMDEAMDHGKVIKEEKCNILENDNMGTLFHKLSILGANTLESVLPSIIDGTNDSMEQDESKVTYAYVLKREEERIDFHKSGKEIMGLIKALNPEPLANMLVYNEEWKVSEASFIPGNSIPNQVMDITKDSIGIGCLDGIIYLKEVKPFGKKLMSVRDYLNGANKEDIKKWVVNHE